MPAPSVELGQTNFGLLAVRVAKTISVHFGGGKLCDSEGRQGEPKIFGKVVGSTPRVGSKVAKGSTVELYVEATVVTTSPPPSPAAPAATSRPGCRRAP